MAYDFGWPVMVRAWPFHSVKCSIIVIFPDSWSCTLLPMNSCNAKEMAAKTSLSCFISTMFWPQNQVCFSTGLFLVHDRVLWPVMLFYIGMLPCFLAGRLSRLVESCARARQMRKRVLRGSITSSM